jgi:hypothetical protein
MIYFIQDTRSKAIKIGISQEPIKRLAALQIAHHSKLILIGVMDGTRATEESLHTLFTRKQGEWFEPTRDLLAFIKQNAVSTSSLGSVTRPRAKRSSILDDYKPELQGTGIVESVARLAVYKGWAGEKLTKIVEIVYPTVEQFSTSHPELFRKFSREELQDEIQRLVDIQNA